MSTPIAKRASRAVMAVAASSMLVAAACALPTLEQSGKNACETTKDCLEGKICSGGRCLQPGQLADGGLGEDSGEDSQGEDSGVTSCPAVPCSAPTTCFHGLCAEVFTTSPACDPYALDDGCPADAICFDDSDEVTRCRRFPPCPDSGLCPVGPEGGICLDGEIPNKTKICLPGSCRDAESCPADWRCIKANDSDPLGLCSDGSSGTPCRVAQDCQSGSCNSFLWVCE